MNILVTTSCASSEYVSKAQMDGQTIMEDNSAQKGPNSGNISQMPCLKEHGHQQPHKALSLAFDHPEGKANSHQKLCYTESSALPEGAYVLRARRRGLSL